MIREFEDPRYRQLGQRVIAAERLDLLASEQQDRFHSWRRERLLAVGDVPWLTLAGAREEARSLEGSAGEHQRQQLLEIQAYLTAIEEGLSKSGG